MSEIKMVSSQMDTSETTIDVSQLSPRVYLVKCGK